MPKGIQEIRKQGKDFCQTEGSEHYKAGGKVEPLDLMISNGTIEGFCLGSIVKYAYRFETTRNLNDLKKISDYAQILAGVEIEKNLEKEGERA